MVSMRTRDHIPLRVRLPGRAPPRAPCRGHPATARGQPAAVTPRPVPQPIGARLAAAAPVPVPLPCTRHRGPVARHRATPSGTFAPLAAAPVDPCQDPAAGCAIGESFSTYLSPSAATRSGTFPQVRALYWIERTFGDGPKGDPHQAPEQAFSRPFLGGLPQTQNPRKFFVMSGVDERDARCLHSCSCFGKAQP